MRGSVGALGLLVTGLAAGIAAGIATTSAVVPTVTVEGKEQPVTVGDSLLVTVEVTLDPAVTLRFPDLGGSWGKFAVLEEEPAETETDEGDGAGTRHRKVYRLAAFEPGTLELPSLSLAMVSSEEETELLETPVVTIEVSSVLQEGDADLADIKPPAFLPVGARWIPWALGALLLALAGAAFWWWRRRRGGAALLPGTPEPPPPPAAEEALAALDRLLASKLLEEGRIKGFHVELSEIAKRYLWRRFGVPTMERTTFEVLRDARAVPLDGWLTDRVGSILNACDGVKFARQRPVPSRARASAEVARELVIRTRPEPEPEAVPLDGEGKADGAGAAVEA